MALTAPRVVDVFCGCGGMSSGFKSAGFDIILGIDADTVAAETYAKNFPETKLIVGDIRKVTTEELMSKTGKRKIHVVVGGPPCQGFSEANWRAQPMDKRNELYKEFMRVVSVIKPDFFVMENVRGILKAKTKRGKPVIKDIADMGRRLGYNVNHRLLLAADFGVPQLRQRVFVIGSKGTETAIPFPETTHAKECQKTLDGRTLKKWASVRKILLPKSKIHEKLFYSEKLIKGFKRRERKNKKHNIGFRWQFLAPEKPSYTIPARYYKDGANALVKYSDSEIRMLATKECARIQSFPDDFLFLGSRKQIYQQIGNAVPPLLSKAIAQALAAEFKSL